MNWKQIFGDIKVKEKWGLPEKFNKYLIPQKIKDQQLEEFKKKAEERINHKARIKGWTKEQRDRRLKIAITRWRARNDLVFLASQLGYKDFGAIHYYLADWFTYTNRFLKDSANVYYRAVFLPRGHFKTTFDRVSIIQGLLQDNTMRYVVVSATQDNARTFMFEPLLRLIQSDFLQTYFPELFNKEVIEINKREMGITIDRSIVENGIRKHCPREGRSIEITSIMSDTTGRHYDKAHLDDVITYKNSQGENSRKRLIELVGMLVPYLDPPYNSFTVFGTIYTEDDWYYKVLLPNLLGNEERVVKYSGRPYVSDKIFWVPALWFEGDEAQIAFPERFSFEMLRSYAEQDYSMFEGQYLLRPSMGNNTIFPPPYGEGRFYHPQSLLNELGLPKNLYVVVGIDPAGSIKNEDDRDYTAIVVAGMDSDGNVYVLDAFAERFLDMELIASMAIEYAKKHGAHEVIVEVGGAQSWLYSTLSRRMATEYPTAFVRKVSVAGRSGGSKNARIASALQGLWNRNKIFFKSDQMALLDQFRAFPNGRHDDLIDALSLAVQFLKPAEDLSSENRLEMDLEGDYSNSLFREI